MQGNVHYNPEKMFYWSYHTKRWDVISKGNIMRLKWQIDSSRHFFLQYPNCDQSFFFGKWWEEKKKINIESSLRERRELAANQVWAVLTNGHRRQLHRYTVYFWQTQKCCALYILVKLASLATSIKYKWVSKNWIFLTSLSYEPS